MGPWRRVAILTACTVILGFAMSASAWSDDSDGKGRFPGLPFLPCATDIKGEGTNTPSLGCDFTGPNFVNDYTWLNFPQVGLAGSVPAKQWARIPISMMATSIDLSSEPRPDEGIQNEYWYKVQAFFVSPDGSPDNYGDSPEIVVRTVAFGSIPTEVTLQVRQKRDAKGLPRPLVFRPHDVIKRIGPGNTTEHTVYPATLEDNIDVSVKSLKVDGSDVRLIDRCSTGTRSRLTVSSKPLSVITPDDWDTSKGLTKLEAEFDPTEYQYGLYGGTLSGSVDIASFRGCRTSTGDDVAPLLTSAISGAGNPVSVRIGAAGGCTFQDEQGRSLPVPPGVTKPDEACPVRDLDMPNKKIVVIPEPFAMPTSAP
ncbi:hypothetical protein [Aeromicrobium erythreum]|uniref:hypothetical protein n=1 Tax=Aeromicrobium erythreum TaxID=2041 RepID=UPI000B2863F1|nr:hypothetical protein [Aeromicrobium erythreum]